jgi:hypothetical protein
LLFYLANQSSNLGLCFFLKLIIKTNGMNLIINNSTEISTYKFSDLSFFEKGVIVTKKNKEEYPILFSELNKIYIKKHQLSYLNKIGVFSVLLILSALLYINLPLEIVFILFILCFPLIAKMSTYKRYNLYLLLYDGTFFIKEFNKKTKDEYINVVSRVSKELFAHQIKYNTQYKKPIVNTKLRMILCL